MSLPESTENLAILEHIAKQSNKSFFIYEAANKRFRYLNTSFEAIWLLSKETINQRISSILDTVHAEDQLHVIAQYHQLLATGENENVEFRIVLPDQKIRWICLSAYAIRSGEHIAYLAGYAEDITRQKEYTYNLLKYNTKKNSILEILSHDLAAPFNTIQGMAALLERKLKQAEDPSVLELLEFIKDNSKRGTDLIRDFVAQEFLESSQVVLTRHRIDIAEKIRIMIDSYKQGEQLIAKQFEVVAGKQPVYMEVDDMKFMQVLNNLISNAIKFTPDDGKISISVEEENNVIRITVADNGIGIPENMQPLLFDKFTKARRPGLKGEKSTGLGMSIIKTIVELHNGRIWFESQENLGSTFYIEIPKE